LSHYRYVSDYAYNGFKALCQNKLLQSARAEAQLARTYPPSLLEWRANRKRANMALEALFPDGESSTCRAPLGSTFTARIPNHRLQICMNMPQNGQSWNRTILI
jgi:hypothetical protein